MPPGNACAPGPGPHHIHHGLDSSGSGDLRGRPRKRHRNVYRRCLRQGRSRWTWTPSVPTSTWATATSGFVRPRAPRFCMPVQNTTPCWTRPSLAGDMRKAPAGIPASTRTCEKPCSSAGCSGKARATYSHGWQFPRQSTFRPGMTGQRCVRAAMRLRRKPWRFSPNASGPTR